MYVRHRIDGLEKPTNKTPINANVRHRIDGLEKPLAWLLLLPVVRHRIDGLEIQSPNHQYH